MIRDSWRDFEFPQLDSLLPWAFSRKGKKIKINGTVNTSMLFKYMKVILTLGTLNYVDSAFHTVHNQAN